jgi:hypothetical protein
MTLADQLLEGMRGVEDMGDYVLNSRRCLPI